MGESEAEGGAAIGIGRPERGEEGDATRMIREERYKLIYYPVGNRVQLFDLQEDPLELKDLGGLPEFQEIRRGLEQQLIEEMYGSDEQWVDGGQLKGEPDREYTPPPNRGLSGWHGLHWPSRVMDTDY